MARFVLLQLLIVRSLSICCWQSSEQPARWTANSMLASRRDFAAAHADSPRSHAIASPAAEGVGAKACMGLARSWARLAARLKESLQAPRRGLRKIRGSLLSESARTGLQCALFGERRRSNEKWLSPPGSNGFGGVSTI